MLTAVQELKLIARCVAFDDRNAFGRLVDAYSSPLKRFVFNLTGDAALTDDIAQEAFLKAWINIRQFKGIARFKTWLFKIAYNEFMTYMRKEQPERLSMVATDLPEPALDNTGVEAGMDLMAALKALSQKEKTVVLLFYLEDLPIKKVVDITGIPEGTVKVYLSRARNKLARFINS